MKTTIRDLPSALLAALLAVWASSAAWADVIPALSMRGVRADVTHWYFDNNGDLVEYYDQVAHTTEGVGYWRQDAALGYGYANQESFIQGTGGAWGLLEAESYDYSDGWDTGNSWLVYNFELTTLTEWSLHVDVSSYGIANASFSLIFDPDGAPATIASISWPGSIHEDLLLEPGTYRLAADAWADWGEVYVSSRASLAFWIPAPSVFAALFLGGLLRHRRR